MAEKIGLRILTLESGVVPCFPTPFHLRLEQERLSRHLLKGGKHFESPTKRVLSIERPREDRRKRPDPSFRSLSGGRIHLVNCTYGMQHQMRHFEDTLARQTAKSFYQLSCARDYARPVIHDSPHPA